MRVSDSIDIKIKRGEGSWNYFYVALGFALAIEGTIIQMIGPLRFPYNILTFGIVSVITIWLFIFSGWFQNKLMGWKAAYEGKAR